MCVYTYICIHVYMYIYVCTYIDTYAHTHTLSHTLSLSHSLTHSPLTHSLSLIHSLTHTHTHNILMNVQGAWSRNKSILCICIFVYTYIQPIADRVAQHLKIISKTFPTNQNSAHGIYDQYQAINDESRENPGTPGTKLKVFRNNLKMLCHPICNWLYFDVSLLN